MKKLLRLLIVLFMLYVLFETAFNLFSKGYKTEYKIDDFNILEKRIKRIKNETDNYYFEITKDDKVFSFQTTAKIANSEKVLSEIKYFKDDNYECVLPITKKNTIISDILCESNGVYYYYNSLINKDSALDGFANDLSGYRNSYVSSDKVLKSDAYITVYDNFEENMSLGLEHYKGIYLVNNKGYTNSQLFTNDIYTKDISTFINGNYIVADYSQEYEFNKFYVINIQNKKQSTIISDKKISMYSYFQGVVDNSAYLIDTSNKIQYEIDLKTKSVTIIGNENDGIKVYKNNNWETKSIYEALNNKLLFDEVNTTFEDREYARVDKVGNELSGYYYLYEKNGNSYSVYKVNVQNKKNLIYLFSIDNIDNILYDEDYVFYKDNVYLKYYSDLSGNKNLVKYDEVDFNSSLKFSFMR